MGGDLLTVRGDTAEEFKNHLADLLADEELQNNLEALHNASF